MRIRKTIRLPPAPTRELSNASWRIWHDHFQFSRQDGQEHFLGSFSLRFPWGTVYELLCEQGDAFVDPREHEYSCMYAFVRWALRTKPQEGAYFERPWLIPRREERPS